MLQGLHSRETLLPLIPLGDPTRCFISLHFWTEVLISPPPRAFRGHGPDPPRPGPSQPGPPASSVGILPSANAFPETFPHSQARTSSSTRGRKTGLYLASAESHLTELPDLPAPKHFDSTAVSCFAAPQPPCRVSRERRFLWKAAGWRGALGLFGGGPLCSCTGPAPLSLPCLVFPHTHHQSTSPPCKVMLFQEAGRERQGSL